MTSAFPQMDLFAAPAVNEAVICAQLARQSIPAPPPDLQAAARAAQAEAIVAAAATAPEANRPSPGQVVFALRKLPGWMKAAALMRRAIADRTGRPGDAQRAHGLEWICAGLARAAAGGDRLAGLKLQREAIEPRRHPTLPDIVMHAGPVMAALRAALEAEIVALRDGEDDRP